MRYVLWFACWALTAGSLHVWFLPNLDAPDLGFFDSFKPAFTSEWKTKTKSDKKSDKKSATGTKPNSKKGEPSEAPATTSENASARAQEKEEAADEPEAEAEAEGDEGEGEALSKSAKKRLKQRAKEERRREREDALSKLRAGDKSSAAADQAAGDNGEFALLVQYAVSPAWVYEIVLDAHNTSLRKFGGARQIFPFASYMSNFQCNFYMPLQLLLRPIVLLQFIALHEYMVFTCSGYFYF